MLKITVQRDETKSTLLLEGKLAGAWVAEVETSWAAERTKAKEVLVDLNEVTFVDTEGKALLTKLHEASLMPDSLHGIPLFVISREDMNDDEGQQQKALAHQSAHSRWEIAVGSGHFVQLERPELVIDAITNVLRGVRGGSGG